MTLSVTVRIVKPARKPKMKYCIIVTPFKIRIVPPEEGWDAHLCGTKKPA